jgi:hypothetical protein
LPTTLTFFPKLISSGVDVAITICGIFRRKKWRCSQKPVLRSNFCIIWQ